MGLCAGFLEGVLHTACRDNGVPWAEFDYDEEGVVVVVVKLEAFLVCREDGCCGGREEGDDQEEEKILVISDINCWRFLQILGGSLNLSTF